VAEAENMHSYAFILRAEQNSLLSALEFSLFDWKPRIPPRFKLVNATVIPKDAEAASQCPRVQAVLHNALSYRHSALVYLYRVGYKSPRGSIDVQTQAHQALLQCIKVISSGGPVNALLWPLFVAACEAVKDEDKALAKQAFETLIMRQCMTNIKRSWELVQQVWTLPGQDKPVYGGIDMAQSSAGMIQMQLDNCIIYG
jgi:hypothetical protein